MNINGITKGYDSISLIREKNISVPADVAQLLVDIEAASVAVNNRYTPLDNFNPIPEEGIKLDVVEANYSGAGLNLIIDYQMPQRLTHKDMCDIVSFVLLEKGIPEDARIFRRESATSSKLKVIIDIPKWKANKQNRVNSSLLFAINGEKVEIFTYKKVIVNGVNGYVVGENHLFPKFHKVKQFIASNADTKKEVIFLEGVLRNKEYENKYAKRIFGKEANNMFGIEDKIVNEVAQLSFAYKILGGLYPITQSSLEQAVRYMRNVFSGNALLAAKFAGKSLDPIMDQRKELADICKQSIINHMGLLSNSNPNIVHQLKQFLVSPVNLDKIMLDARNELFNFTINNVIKNKDNTSTFYVFVGESHMNQLAEILSK